MVVLLVDGCDAWVKFHTSEVVITCELVTHRRATATNERAKDFASVRLYPFGRIAVGKPPQVWEPVGLILFTVLHILKDLVVLALWSCRPAIVAAG